MALLTVVADDLGICAQRDVGILRAHCEGVVCRASVLANGPTANDALRLSSDAGLPVGLHLNLTEGRPLSLREDVRCLVDPTGHMLGKHGFRTALAAALDGKGDADHSDFVGDIRREIRAQLDWLQRASSLPSHEAPPHVDGHQHVHVIPAVARELVADRRVRRTRVPYEDLSASPWIDDARRAFYERVCADARESRALFDEHGVAYTRAFVGLGLMGRDMSVERVCETMQGVVARGADTVEFMCHPGLADESWDDFNVSPDREWELSVLCSDDLKMALAAAGFRLDKG